MGSTRTIVAFEDRSEVGASTDAELVARAVAGDEAAYAAIYDRHHAVVARVARERLGRQGDPDDVVQDVFTTAWTKLATLRDPSQLRPWLLQITRRRAIDHGRRFRRTPTSPEPDDVLAETAALDAGPDEQADLHELAQRLEVGLRGLSRRDALAISLATHFGFGPDEIAEALGVTPGNAKVVLHRARRRLRAAIEASGTDLA